MGIHIGGCWASNPFISDSITIVSYWAKGETNVYISKEVHSLEMHGGSFNALISLLLTIQQQF